MADEYDNEMERRRSKAWAEYARGTFSATDKKIFDDAFLRGWRAAKREREVGDGR